MYGVNGKVDLTKMTDENIVEVNKYMHSIGFNLIVDKLVYNAEYASDVLEGRYDKIVVTPGMSLNKLYMPVLSGNLFYLIRFDLFM